MSDKSGDFKVDMIDLSLPGGILSIADGGQAYLARSNRISIRIETTFEVDCACADGPTEGS